MEACLSICRCLENIPLIGHGVAALYACCKNKDKAERAGIKATIGIIFCVCNFPAECVDECARKRSPKLRSTSLSPRPDWMKKHHDRILRNICLPASHQSGSSHIEKKVKQIPLVEGWSRCQMFSIEEQLFGGVRFLDLRLMTDENDIWIHHNLVICIQLKNVLGAVRDFINRYPSEIVFLYMTNDGKHLDWGLVHTYLQEYLGGRMIHEHKKEMIIGDIIDQGKNVVIFGVPNVAYSWRGLDYRWPNKCWPHELKADIQSTISELQLYPSQNLYWYKAECTPNTNMVIRSIGGAPGAVYARFADEKLEFVEDLAAAANNEVLDVLETLSSNPINVLSTDYVQNDIIRKIIQLNDQKEKGVIFDTVDMGSETDDVFADNPTLKLTNACTTVANDTFNSHTGSKQSIRSLNRSLNTTTGSATFGTSFEIKVKPGPPLEVRETGL